MIQPRAAASAAETAREQMSWAKTWACPRSTGKQMSSSWFIKDKGWWTTPSRWLLAPLQNDSEWFCSLVMSMMCSLSCSKTQLNDQLATSLPNHGYCLCGVVHPQCIPSQIGCFLIRSAHFGGWSKVASLFLDNHLSYAHIVWSLTFGQHIDPTHFNISYLVPTCHRFDPTLVAMLNQSVTPKRCNLSAWGCRREGNGRGVRLFRLADPQNWTWG